MNDRFKLQLELKNNFTFENTTSSIYSIFRYNKGDPTYKKPKQFIFDLNKLINKFIDLIKPQDAIAKPKDTRDCQEYSKRESDYTHF